MIDEKNMKYVYVGVVALILLVAGFFMFGTAGEKDTTSEEVIKDNAIEKFIDDDPTLGNKDAEIIIIEFSDYQCPFCRKFWRESLPTLKEEYIDTGKVLFVYRDFPLPNHPMAQKSAEAAECAREQGKFWEMHDKIFEEQQKEGDGTIDYSLEDLRRWASEIGLDMQEFNTCLDSGKYEKEVRGDYRDGSALGVTGTPGFLIGKRGEEGRIIVGAYPYETFNAIIKDLMES